MKGRVLIIGIDGGTWKVLDRAIEAGYMPNLKNLKESGAAGILESTMPAITPAAWGSFQTGKNPGRTGVFDFTRWDRETKERKIVSSRDLGRTVWDIAGKAGRKVGVVNVPMTYPPKEINGYMVTGVLTPDTNSKFTHPEGLRKEILKQVPGYHVFNLQNVRNGSPHERFEAFLDDMAAIIEARTEVARVVLEKEKLDLFMVHYFASDVVQHVMWGYIDPDCPHYDVVKAELVLSRFYSALDREIGKIVDLFGQGAVFIVSDHGFQRHEKRFNLGNWLVEKGFMEVDEEAFEIPKHVEGIRKVDPLNLRRFIPHGVRKKVAGEKDEKDRYEWEGSKVYSMGRSGEGFIYLLEDDDKCRMATARRIKEGLEQVSDGDRLVVSSVLTKEEVFSGNRLGWMPDLIVVPAAGYTCTGFYQHEMDRFHIVNTEDDFHMGRHHRDGILVANGKGIAPVQDLRTSIMDIAPTVLAYLGIDIPGDMDGKEIDLAGGGS